EVIAALVDIAEVNGRADVDLARIRLLLPGDDLEQGRLAGAVGPDHADDPAGWQSERQVLEQQLIAVGLADTIPLDDLATEPLGDLDENLRFARNVLFL